jgi:hypothetical protein
MCCSNPKSIVRKIGFTVVSSDVEGAEESLAGLSQANKRKERKKNEAYFIWQMCMNEGIEKAGVVGLRLQNQVILKNEINKWSE